MFFCFLRNEDLNIYVQRDKATVCLARLTKRNRWWQQHPKKKWRREERRSCTHTLTHSLTHSHQKWHSRRSERKWWPNNEQKIHKNSLM